MQLTESEKKVLVELAEKGLLSGYDFHLGGQRVRGEREAIMSSSNWLKVRKSLLAKRLIEQQTVKGRGSPSSDKRGRRKDLYWLTEEGIVSTVLNHANLRKLRQNTKRIYGEIENLEAFYDMVEVIGIAKTRGLVELSKQYKTQAQVPDYLVVAPQTLVDNPTQLETLSRLIKKYPNVKKDYEAKSKRTRAKLRKIERYLRA